MKPDELVTREDLENAVSALTQQLIEIVSMLRMKDNELVLNVKGAAEFLKCSEDTIRKRAARGEIAYSKDGKDLKFLSCDLMAYMKSKRVCPKDEIVTLAKKRHFELSKKR